MLKTRDLPPVNLKKPISAPCGVLIVAGGQVLGGGRYEPIVTKAPTPPGARSTIIDAWAVSDLTTPWQKLVLGEQAAVHEVPVALMESVRDTMERFHAFGDKIIQAERNKREGVLEAVQRQAVTMAALATKKSTGG